MGILVTQRTPDGYVVTHEVDEARFFEDLDLMERDYPESTFSYSMRSKNPIDNCPHCGTAWDYDTWTYNGPDHLFVASWICPECWAEVEEVW